MIKNLLINIFLSWFLSDYALKCLLWEALWKITLFVIYICYTSGSLEYSDRAFIKDLLAIESTKYGNYDVS